jgi:hypothetical protein
MKSIAIMLGIACAVATLATPAVARQPTRATDTEVTLVIYSGRVDPMWVLTAAETAAFRKRLAALIPAAAPFGEPEWPGYLRIQLPGDSGARDSVIIGRGKVILGSGATARFFVDADRRLEKWLLKTQRD